jgi:predicted ATP-binding protein involved in virulence
MLTTDLTLAKTTLLEEYQNYNMNHIVITSYFKEIKSVTEIRDGINITRSLKTDLIKDFYSDKNILIAFPAEIINNINQILAEKTSHPSFIFKTVTEIKQQKRAEPPKVWDFETDNVLEIWNEILQDINAYKFEELKYTQQIGKAYDIDTQNANHVFINALKIYKQWKQEHPNPIEQLAQKLNPILNKFSLAVKTSFDFESIEDLKFIQIQSKGGTEIPYSGWSTGTKQVLLTMTPLLKLETDDSIILVDEPERSLYPDIQTEIVNSYKEAAPKAQFFFATHSPIIASAFEPWEIVELKFNQDGTVYQEKYYKGERHVDNYFIDPRYLRWDVILMRVFDLGIEGNEKFRNRALTKAARLEKTLSKLRAENKIDTEEGQKAWAAYSKLATKLAWRLKAYDED